MAKDHPADQSKCLSEAAEHFRKAGDLILDSLRKCQNARTRRELCEAALAACNGEVIVGADDELHKMAEPEESRAEFLQRVREM